MDEYIDKEAFIKHYRKLLCEDCGRRKGMKNGKLKFCYAIGEAPCRACAIDDMLTFVEDFPAADVEERKTGKWVLKTFDDGYGEYQLYECDKCGAVRAHRANYCHNCGARMVEE